MKIIGANFKMNFKKDDINNYLEVIKNKFPIDNIIFFPSDLYIEDFSKNNYLVGSQNISFQEFGAVTGDTSILQLKELGIKYTEPQGAYYVLVDISEFGYDDDVKFCEDLARIVGVGAVPGSSFFKENVNHLIRFHFAKKDETLLAALDKLKDMKKKMPHY